MFETHTRTHVCWCIETNKESISSGIRLPTKATKSKRRKTTRRDPNTQMDFITFFEMVFTLTAGVSTYYMCHCFDLFFLVPPPPPRAKPPSPPPPSSLHTASRRDLVPTEDISDELPTNVRREPPHNVRPPHKDHRGVALVVVPVLLPQ